MKIFFQATFGLNHIECVVLAIVLTHMLCAMRIASLTSRLASRNLAFRMGSLLEFLALNKSSFRLSKIYLKFVLLISCHPGSFDSSFSSTSLPEAHRISQKEMSEKSSEIDSLIDDLIFILLPALINLSH